MGHGGASGYLAAMALFNLAPEVIKPTALVLNLFVAVVGTVRYARAGCFSWRIFWPFAVLSIPFAFLGGMWKLPVTTYRIILGAGAALSRRGDWRSGNPHMPRSRRGQLSSRQRWPWARRLGCCPA